MEGLRPIRTTLSQVDAHATKDVWAEAKAWLHSRRHVLQKGSSLSGVSTASDSSDHQIPLSPLSQFFMNVRSPPDIYAIMQLEGYCSVEDLMKPMQLMADLHDRFRRRVVFRGVWMGEVLEEFDVRTLMREVTLEGPDSQQAFDDLMGQLMSNEPLGEGGMPPWDVHCIHYASDPNRTDVLMRASHIIGDGQLFMKLIKQIMEPQDATAEADFAAAVLDCGDKAAGKSPSGVSPDSTAVAATEHVRSRSNGSNCSTDSDIGSACSNNGRASTGSSYCGSSDAASSSSSSSTAGEQLDGTTSQQSQKQRGRWSRHGQWQAIYLLLMPWKLLAAFWHGLTALLFTAILPFWISDPVTVVKAGPDECSGPRRWSSHTLHLPEFHHTARVLGHSVNALAVTCLAGGIRRYMLRHGVAVANRVRLCSMVDTRSMPGLLTGTSGNSNNFSFIGVPLFTGDCGPLVRLARAGWALSWIRHSLAVPLAIRMPSIIQFIFRDPAWSSWAILRCLPSKATIGFSNMRGPSGRWSLSGHPVLRIHNGVQPNAFGTFISLFSYNDTITFTHTCYETKTSTPGVLLDCIVEEYAALRKAAAISAVGSAVDGVSAEAMPTSPGTRIKAA